MASQNCPGPVSGKKENARSHKSHAAVDYTPIGVEPHGPTRGV